MVDGLDEAEPVGTQRSALRKERDQASQQSVEKLAMQASARIVRANDRTRNLPAEATRSATQDLAPTRHMRSPGLKRAKSSVLTYPRGSRPGTCAYSAAAIPCQKALARVLYAELS